MTQDEITIGYDEYMSLPREKRNIVFGEISVENCALIMKTHVERWLEANRLRLNQEQVIVIEEFISSIMPESYQAKRDYLKVKQKAEKLYAKAEAVFPQEDIIQFAFLSGGQCGIS
ncbi:MAG TPA: hypothetical protein PKE69_09390 [Pyrinomonadaceae bacterium]|nr:hypothetical protein [Pyrinomonadaceae bacterium]